MSRTFHIWDRLFLRNCGSLMTPVWQKRCASNSGMERKEGVFIISTVLLLTFIYNVLCCQSSMDYTAYSVMKYCINWLITCYLSFYAVAFSSLSKTWFDLCISLPVSTSSRHPSTLKQRNWTVQKTEEWLFSPAKRFAFVIIYNRKWENWEFC